MTITRFAPFRTPLSDVALLQNRLNSIFHDFAQPGSGSADATESLATGNFVPAVDVYEDAQKLVLKLEVPGIKPEDLDIRVEGRTLTVKGERKFENEEKQENYTRVERRFGSFVRSFTLPTSVNTDNVQAVTEHGVLSLSFDRKPESKPRQIEVKAGNSSAAQPKQVEAEAATK
jgi:HSP20 family protein